MWLKEKFEYLTKRDYKQTLYFLNHEKVSKVTFFFFLRSIFYCVFTKTARVSKTRNGYKLCHCCLMELVISQNPEKHNMEKNDSKIDSFKRCDTVTPTLEDPSEEQLKNDNVLVKIYFKRMESHLQSFGNDFQTKPKIIHLFSESTIIALDRFDRSSIGNI